MRSFGCHTPVDRLMLLPESGANHFASSFAFGTSGINSRKCVEGQSRLMVASVSSMRSPRSSSSRFWASSKTTSARGRDTFLLRTTRSSFSGVATRT